MLDRCHHTLFLLGILAALPSAVGAVDIGERALLDAQSTLNKGDQRPISPTELTKAFESLVATGQLPAIIGPAKSTGDPRLGTRLKHLVAVQRFKGGDALPQTLATLIAPVSTETVPLTLLAESATESAQLLDLARRHGGAGQISDATSTVWVTLPSGRLEGFLDAAGAARHLDLQTRNEPFFGPATGEGGTMMKVSALHDAGVKGQGVTVAVLDMGFKGYTELVKTGELPKARVTQAFGSYAFEERSEHGAACAEIVADIAPAADQVLVRFDGGPQSLQESLQWLRTQKDVTVVNASWGSHLRRTDGLDATDQEINRFVKETGVLWVNAAGNDAQRVWSGPILDQNGNNLIEFPVDGKNREFLIVKAPGSYYIQVQWDDWGTSIQPTATQDLDACLLVMRDGQLARHGDCAQEVQNGQQYPMEVLQGSGLPGGAYHLSVPHHGANAVEGG